jgi:TusA-related sulfurtransferase
MKNLNKWHVYCSISIEDKIKPMEINLCDMIWPVCVLRCNEALARLQPGEKLIIIICDLDIINNIILLIKSQEDLKYDSSNESGSYRIVVTRMRAISHGVEELLHGPVNERS